MITYADGSVPRGCGTRKHGGVYAECGRSPFGKPVEWFLLCPPVPVDPASMGLSPIGVKLIENAGVWHVWDWVGSKFYPNVADFVEEVRRFGMSRRLPKTLDFKKLTPDSRMFLLHAQAIIDNPSPFHAQRIGGKRLGMEWSYCPKEVHEAHENVMCAGLWWEDVKEVDQENGRCGLRTMPAFKYQAAYPIVPSTHSLALFASFPISRLAVVASEDGSHVEAYDRAQVSSLEVDIVEE